MNSYWFNDQNAIKSELLNEQAEAVAETLIRENRGKYEGVTSSQLRKLYGEVKSLERRAQISEESWVQVKPLVKMLKAKTAYSAGRAIQKKRWDEKEYSKLKKYIFDSVDNIDELKDFDAFCKQFEAVVGFYYGITKGTVK